MAKKLQTPDGRAVYKLRQQMVEPVIGWLKEHLGFRGFRLRGLDKCEGELALVGMASNLVRMLTLSKQAKLA